MLFKRIPQTIQIVMKVYESKEKNQNQLQTS